MPKVRLTKNELKQQRDALKRFERYLPTILLKKQQLQMEVRQVWDAVETLRGKIETAQIELEKWWHILVPAQEEKLADAVQITHYRVSERNVAGIDIPVFESIEFAHPRYDLFLTPVWFDDVVAAVKRRIEDTLKLQILEKQHDLLAQELRVVSQRVNLFEKVKIPECRENIRRIQIYLGDQQTSAVGRAKIAKEKCRLRDLEADVAAT